MKLLHTSRRFGKEIGRKLSRIEELPAIVTNHLPSDESPLLKTIGWVSAGVGALAIGVVVGRELRIRYKFNRRTPYDLYAHSGDEQDVDFGLGI
jgi:hypothetical protein